MPLINVIGLDCALSNCGVAVASINPVDCRIERIEHLQTFTTKKSKDRNVRVGSDHVSRARYVNESICAVMQQHNVRFAFAEIPSGGKTAAVATSFGIVQGMLACLPVPLFEVTPTEVKVRSVNDRHADKWQIIEWAIKLPMAPEVSWPMSRQPNENGVQTPNGMYIRSNAEHIADACAIIQAGITGNEFRRAVAMVAQFI